MIWIQETPPARDAISTEIREERRRLCAAAGPVAMELHTGESWREWIRCQLREGDPHYFRQQMLTVAVLLPLEEWP